jgi:hypothetical protein
VVIERLHEPGHQPTPPSKNATSKSVNRSSTPLMIEEKENEQLLIVCDRLAIVLRLQTAGQAVVLLGISTRRKATQELPRQLFHSSRFLFPAVIVGLS